MNELTIKNLPAPEYSEEEYEKIVDYLIALKKLKIQDFLEKFNISKTGNKSELRERIEETLDNGDISYRNIVDYIDVVAPWSKQHVILYDGPSESISKWKDPKWVTEHLKDNRVGKYLNARLPLILPTSLKISSIEHTDSYLRVTAVERHEHWERYSEYDKHEATPEGEDIELRAYLHLVTRGLVIFEWNLIANTAFLQISQLHSGSDYEKVVEKFSRLIKSWLDLSKFSLCDLRPVIKRLHELEEQSNPEARSHGIDYRTLQGRRLSGRSASVRDSVLGEPVIDNAMKEVRKKGVGHLGNFYWLPAESNSSHNNPLDEEVHIVIVGDKNRLNFTTPNSEGTVRYVLTRVRAFSR